MQDSCQTVQCYKILLTNFLNFSTTNSSQKMITAKDKLAFLERFKDAVIPEDVLPDHLYIEAMHVMLPYRPEIMTDKVIWSGSCQWLSGVPRQANTPDAAFVWAAVSFIQKTEHGDIQVGQILFPGVWAVQIYQKWLVLWNKDINIIKAAHERYGLTFHRLVNRQQGLLLASHANLDETIGFLN